METNIQQNGVAKVMGNEQPLQHLHQRINDGIAGAGAAEVVDIESLDTNFGHDSIISQTGSTMNTPIHRVADDLDGAGDMSLLDEEEIPIDDSEFNIPTVSFEPSLESIMNDLDMDSLSEEDAFLGITHESVEADTPIQQLGAIPEGSDTISVVSKGSDNRSRSSSRSWRPKSNVTSTKKPNSILRHVVLKGMTSHINIATEKINAGTATAICLGSFVAVGTSHGFVIVFNVLQVVKWCLGDLALREAGGSVSSLAINPNGNRLLVGYAKGLILMYELENGKLIRTIPDAHAVATAVLTLRFTDFADLALCGDSGGSVFALNFKRAIMGVRSCESRCIFSGSRGEVCTFEPLLLQSFPHNPLSKYVLIAFATLSKIIVVMIRPKLKVLFSHSLICDPTTLPLVSWQMVIIQTPLNEKIVDPVLSFARHNVITFLQVTVDSKNSIQFLPLRTMTVGYSLLSMHWLNARTLAVVDIKERLRILDVRSQEELENVDLSSTRLVYASSHYKGLATGGNVSKAFALAGDRACYNSILCHDNQIVVLGTKSVHALTIRVWHERLDYLVRQHHYIHAIQLGYELYLEKAKAVVGLKGSKDSKRLIVRDKLLYILERFVDRIPLLNYMDDLTTAEQRYHETIFTCVNHYVLLDNTEPIFEKLYDFCAENPFSKSAYLESLESFILNDQLRYVPPTIAKDFVTHYDETENYKALEACVVHMDVASLDIHQTMKLCWSHGLYDAIIYIFNRGMNDYVTPLEELRTELNSAISAAEMQLTDSQVVLGNKLLVYVSCCLAGRAYPYGNISYHLVEKVQTDVFQLITALHSRNSTESESSYPYLRTFLHFDTREFLNVLSLSFEEPIFKSELGRRQKQRIVDILLQVMVEQGNFTPTQVGILFTFLARQMAKSENSLFVSKLLFEQVLEHLTSANEVSRIDERQQALMELLQAGGLQHFDHEKLLQKCLKAKFFRVCEMLYERKNEYPQIIECYLRDEARKHQVFSFLHKIFCLMPQKKEIFQSKVMEYLEQLIEIDNKKCAQVVYLHLGNLIPDLVKTLDTLPNKQYSFLQGVFYTREQNQNNIQVDTLTTEKYIGLMCHFNPQLVYPFLKSIESYRNEKAMEVCEKHKLVDAMGYLLEKDGLLNEAFDLMLNQFQAKLTQIYAGIEKVGKEDANYEVILSSISWNQLQAIFLVMIQFSQRNSPKLQPDDKENLWLPLLQCLIEAHNKFQSVSDISTAFNDMNKHLLGSMMGHVSLPTIVEVVLNNPSYQTATFGEIRELVIGMLETCTYEEMMIDLVKKITQSDVHDKMKVKLKNVKAGISAKNPTCWACQSQLVDFAADEADVVVFQCGHSYHLSCCQQKSIKSCPQCSPPSTVPLVSSVKELDVSFHIPRQHTASFTMNDDTEIDGSHDSRGGCISQAEFELQLNVPFKINLKDF